MFNNHFNSFLLAFVPYSIVPINELYAWSNNQKIHILFHKIAELIEASNGYDKLFMEVKKLLEDFDEELGEKVEEILQYWYDNGELDDKLATIVSEYLSHYQTDIENTKEYLENNPKTTTVDFERMYRILKETNNYLYTQPDLTDPADDQRTARYTFGQGSCHYFKNGSSRNVTIYIANDGNQFDLNGKGKIEIYDNNGNVLNNKEFLTTDIGHGQCICYHNDKLYFSGSYSGDPDYVHKIRWINEDLTGSTYGTILSNFLYVNGISSYNNEVYVASALASEISVAKLQFENDNVTVKDEVTNILTMSPMNIKTARGGNRNTIFSGGFSVTKDFYYFGTHKPTGILKCKRNYDSDGNEISFTPYWWYQIPDKLNAREFKTGELEAMTVYDNGDCYIYTTQHLNTKAICCHDINQVFKQNLINNTNLPIVNRSEFTGRCNIYVVNSSVTSYTHSTNPFGTSYNDAFATIDEAVWWFNNCEQYNYGHFFMQGHMPHVVFCVNGKCYYFDGNDNENSNTVNNHNITMLGNLVQYGGIVTISSCICSSTIHYWANGNSYLGVKRHPIYAVDGVLTIANSGVNYSNNPNIHGGLYLSHIIGNYNWSWGDSAYTQAGFVSHTSGKYWCDPTTSTINWHNDASRSGNGSQIIEGNNSLYLND